MLNFIDELTGIEFICAGLALILVLIISLPLHEFGHAFVAYKQGDQTPKAMGRVTLNPFAHIDPIGLICCVLFGFGWAKPVEVNPLKFRSYKKGMFLTSIAGVCINLILAFVGCGLMHLTVFLLNLNSLPLDFNWLTLFIYFFTSFMFQINVCLFVFNLLPIYPLDGFNAIAAYAKYENKFVNFMRRYGNLILIAVLIFGDFLLFWLCKYIGMPIDLFWGLIF